MDLFRLSMINTCTRNILQLSFNVLANKLALPSNKVFLASNSLIQTHFVIGGYRDTCYFTGMQEQP